MSFENDGDWFRVSVPLIDAVQFCCYLEDVQRQSRHGALRYLCAAAISAVGPPQWSARETLQRISRRVDVVESDGLLARCWERALTNDLAIAAGGSLLPTCSLPELGAAMNRELKIRWPARDAGSYFEEWNKFLDAAEEKAGRERVHEYLHAAIQRVGPTDRHRAIASLPISNFIDATLDRSLTKALIDAGKRPIIHDETTFSLGSWKETEVDTPHVFYVLGQPKIGTGFRSPRAFLRGSQAGSFRENIADMLARKDLLLLDFAAFEAEFVLGLSYFAAATPKIVNCAGDIDDAVYWARCGVYVSPLRVDDYLDGLRPAAGMRYSDLDVLVPTETLIEIGRKKPHDCFFSYSRRDHEFVEQLDRALQRRRVRVWRDVKRVEAGSPIAATLEAELAKSHCFVIVLSPDAVASQWVKRELETALRLNARGEIAILPVWLRQCEIPQQLRAFDIVDLRDAGAFEHEVKRLTDAIRNAASRAIGKLRV